MTEKRNKHCSQCRHVLKPGAPSSRRDNVGSVAGSTNNENGADDSYLRQFDIDDQSARNIGDKRPAESPIDELEEEVNI